MVLSSDLGKDKAVLGTILRCSRWFELRTSELYRVLSDKVVDKDAASLLMVISQQSFSHSKSIEALMRLYGIRDAEVPDEVCEELMKPIGPITNELIRKLNRVEEVGLKEYDELLNDLRLLECGVGEEAYTRILLPLLKDALNNVMVREARDGEGLVLKSKMIDELVDDIVRQEKLHEILVMDVHRLLQRKESTINPTQVVAEALRVGKV